MNPETNKIILYTAPNGDIRVDVYVEDETVWLTQKSMAKNNSLQFFRSHCKNVFTTEYPYCDLRYNYYHE